MVKFHCALGMQGNKKTFEKFNSLGPTLLVEYENLITISDRMIRIRKDCEVVPNESISKQKLLTSWSFGWQTIWQL
jgi:hypothetical protein